jgi:hypothetical protein
MEEPPAVRGCAVGRARHNVGVSEQPGRYERSFGGMVGAMILLLLVVGAFVVFRDVNRTEPADPVRPVEWRGATSYARGEADFRLLAPGRVPEGWVATSVRFERQDGQSWHLGFLTDEQRYVGLEQSEEPPSTMVEQFVDEEAERGEDVIIDGRTWQAWSDERDNALVREGDDVTTLVVGSVPKDVLVDFVRSLR